MTFSIKSLLISIGVANFLALNLFTIIVVYSDVDVKSVSFIGQLGSYLEMVVLFAVIGLPVSLVTTTLVGGPLYVLARLFGCINISSALLSGALIAVIPVLISNYFQWNIPSIADKNGVILYLSLAACGGIGGLTYWRLEKGH